MIAGALAGGVAGLFEAGLTGAVRVATTKSLLNVIGTAIGACRHPAVDVVVETALAYGAAPVAPVAGRAERLDAPSAALATGVAAHLDDFDDTHLVTVVHPTASVLSAALPTVSAHDVPGARLVDAAALGIEAQLRVATAMSPEHYDAGWHITGTVGVVGAAVTAGLLLGLDDQRLADGTVGLAQYDDERVGAPDLVSLRDRITLLPDPQVARDAAAVEVDLAGGGTLRETVEHARGSLSRPMTDAELDAKVTTLVDRTWPGQAAEILETVRALPEADSCTPLLDAVSRKGQ